MDRETTQELESENRFSNMYLLRGRVRRVQSLAVLMWEVPFLLLINTHYN